MNYKLFKITFIFILAALVMNGCSKQETDPLLDLRPDVPVSINNATEYRPDPTVTTSMAGGGNIQVVLSIPVEAGRRIAEITRIAASTSYTRIQSSGTSGFYVATPIPVNGTTYTYNTTLTEYFTKNPVSTANPAAKANTELALRFYFLITLDDGTKLVTMPVRILVLA
jgi:hypothetical protein